jgi:hypothetical protein
VETEIDELMMVENIDNKTFAHLPALVLHLNDLPAMGDSTTNNNVMRYLGYLSRIHLCGDNPNAL